MSTRRYNYRAGDRAFRRRTGGRRRQGGGGITRPVPFRGIFTKSHHFKQMLRPTNLVISGSASGASYDQAEGLLLGPTTAATSDCFFTYYFSLDELSSVSSFTSLFDAYRINKVVLICNPVQNVNGNASLQTPTGHLSQELITVIDRDDVTQLSTSSAFEEYETYKRTGCYEKHVRKWVPSVSAQVFKTSGTTIGYSQRTKQWIDMAQTDVQHYGIKGNIPSSAGALDNYRCGWYVRVKVYFSCKQVR